MLSFRKITSDDIPTIKYFTRNCGIRSCDFTLCGIYLWGVYYGVILLIEKYVWLYCKERMFASSLIRV